MTQPAKVQEPSMEEILASIRRIIADDEAKPPAAEKPAVAAAPEPVKPVPRPAAVAEKPPAPAAAVPKPAPPPPAPVSNNQDDIDALLSGLDMATSPEEIRPAQPEPEPEVLELTDEMAVPTPAPPRSAFHKIEPSDDIEFAEAAASRASHLQAGGARPAVGLRGQQGQRHRLVQGAVGHRRVRRQVEGTDLVMTRMPPARFGMGFYLPGPLLGVELPNPNSLYGGGGGCSWILIDMDARTTFAYTANQLDRHPMGDPRAIRTMQAMWQSLGIRSEVHA